MSRRLEVRGKGIENCELGVEKLEERKTEVLLTLLPLYSRSVVVKGVRRYKCI